VTGFIPAAGYIGDGRGQMLAQLAGVGAIVLLAVLVGWVVSLALSLPYRQGREEGEEGERAGILAPVRMKAKQQSRATAEAEDG
jgi:hypothetical protein